MFVKICGIKNIETAEKVIELGGDCVGFVAHKKSKRYITPEEAEKIVSAVKGRAVTVAVGVSADECVDYGFCDYIQADDACRSERDILCGYAEPAGIFKYFLYDKSRGEGVFSEYPDWIEEYRDRLILAGGLTPENVADVVKRWRPFGVDVSSGVETEGIKDFEKIKRFIYEAKNG
ncbi:MAG: phosphoribosylanthranilate isomerase [Deferribacterales bacterium]